MLFDDFEQLLHPRKPSLKEFSVEVRFELNSTIELSYNFNFPVKKG